MLRKDRMSGILLRDTMNPHFRLRSLRRRANKANHGRPSLAAPALLAEHSAQENAAAPGHTARPSYSCRLYAASAT
jgi:hypothetical protein